MESAPPIAPANDPYTLFDAWFSAAAAKEPGLPEAMSLATTTPDGRPSLRMVLLKAASPEGFVFYTNFQSRKGEEIAANPWGALCLYWKSVSRQVRAEGRFTPVTEAEADAYWESRPRDSQIAAWASAQSDRLDQRDTLFSRFDAAKQKYEGGPVPRPPQWSGYRLAPQTIEFWQDVPNRLHDRVVYERVDTGWRHYRLYP